MALVRRRNRQVSVATCIAERVQSLKEQLVIESRLATDDRDAPWPQGPDRKRVERLVAAADARRNQDQIPPGDQVAQQRVLIISQGHGMSLPNEAVAKFLILRPSR